MQDCIGATAHSFGFDALLFAQIFHSEREDAHLFAKMISNLPSDVTASMSTEQTRWSVVSIPTITTCSLLFVVVDPKLLILAHTYYICIFLQRWQISALELHLPSSRCFSRRQQHCRPFMGLESFFQ